MINIIRGDTKTKPASTGRLIEYFEGREDDSEGCLYTGYPIIGSIDGGVEIDAMLISKKYGVVSFVIEEGRELHENYRENIDDNFSKIQSRLTLNKDLVNKRTLQIPITSVVYAPALLDPNFESETDYPVLQTSNDLDSLLNQISWENSDSYYNSLVSTIQSITNLRKTSRRKTAKIPTSKGSLLRRLEESISNLDSMQASAVIETSDGVQRIRGLAGSGKTIVLALKIAYLHAKNRDWDIAVTFNTRSLKAQVKRLIRMFCFEHIGDEPDWSKVHILHAWGSPKEEGIYYNLCREHNNPYMDFASARQVAKAYGDEFNTVCEKAIGEIQDISPKYDLLVVDEAQDFAPSFLRICYRLLKDPKRLVYAYDELQNLTNVGVLSPEELFGCDAVGNPFVSLSNKEGKPKEDIILPVCYRNSREVLVTAHSLGFGVYRDEGLAQMFENSQLWSDIGYKVVAGELSQGSHVELARSNRTSPQFLSEISSVDDRIIVKSFLTNAEQIDYVTNEIQKNLSEDELTYGDIIVIHTDPLTTKQIVGPYRDRLYKANINSNLAGISTSPDIFFEDSAVVFTSIHRAKGNEAAMVYVINSQNCFSGNDIARKRNILFTAITRSKAWVRICGYSPKASALEEEYQRLKNNDFKLIFSYPTKEEQDKINIVNRDMTYQERKALSEGRYSLERFLAAFKSGTIRKEDIPSQVLDQLRELL